MKQTVYALLMTTTVCLLPVLPMQLQAQETDGGSYLETLLEDSLSDAGRQVEITGFTGALSSKARLDSLTIADEQGIWLRLENVELDWTRSALLQGRVEVTLLQAERLHLPRLPQPDTSLPSPEAHAFTLPDLPVAINIGTLNIQSADIGADVLGQDTRLRLNGNMALAGGTGDTQLTIKRLDKITDSFSLAARYDNDTQHAAIDLALTEGTNGLLGTALDLPGKPALDFTINGNGPLSDFSATIMLASDGIERLRGVIQLTQPVDASDHHILEAQLNGDLTPLFAPEYRDFFGTELSLNLRGQRKERALSLENLVLQSQAMQLTGQLQTQDGWPQIIELKGSISHADGAPVRLPVSGPVTEIDSAQFSLKHNADISPDWLFTSELVNLSQPDLRLSQLRLSGAGQILRDAAPEIDGKLLFVAEGIAPKDMGLSQALGTILTGSAQLNAGQDRDLSLQDLRLSGEDYRLQGDLSLRQDGGNGPTLQTDLALKAEQLNRFSLLLGQRLQGAADLSVKGQYQPLSGGFDVEMAGRTTELSVSHPQIDPLLQGDAQLTLQAHRDETGTHLDALTLASDTAQITAQAQLKSLGSTAVVTAAVTDIALLAPNPSFALSGPAELQLNTTQETRQDWALTARAKAPGGMLADADLVVRAPSGRTPQISGQISAALPDLRQYGQLFGQSLEGGLTLAVNGTSQPRQGTFDLSLTASADDLSLNNTQIDPLIAGQTELTLTAEKTSQQPLFLRELAFSSQELSAQLSGTGDANAADVTYSAHLRDMALLGAGISGAIEAQGRAELRADTWHIDSLHTGPGDARLRTNGTLAQDFSLADLSIAGRLPLSLANPLIQPRNVQGFADVDLRLNGPLTLSARSGEIHTKDTRLALPPVRQSSDAIDGHITLQDNAARLSFDAQHVLGGAITLNGQLGLNDGMPADMALRLENVVARDPNLYDTRLSGDLTISGALANGQGTIAGDLTLGPTELSLPSHSAPSTSNLPGLVHRNEPADVRQVRRWAGLIETTQPSTTASGSGLALDVLINAPNQIFVRGRGLDAELGGQLRLGGSRLQIVPEGQFDLIRGRMDILGSRLTLTEGLIQMQGSFDPFLRFVAETTANAVTAMITIEGTTSAPELRFSSVPQLPEDEILSLLLFGRELSSISPLQAIRLASALATLTGQGGEGLTGGTRRELALDDLDVSTSEDGTTEARIGKYINDNIYTEITADTAGQTRIDLNLQLSPNITAKGRLGSDGQTGLGLFIERDY
jgi:translocation and assembly module TamB